ncbi:MAG: hypothetical protein IKW48_09210 [Akkermansia sp.]|nr:hypothetical protein [Akkermansia sp.]
MSKRTTTPSPTAEIEAWPTLTMEEILRMHEEDTPTASAPLWLKGAVLLAFALNIGLLFYFSEQNSGASERLETASVSVNKVREQARMLKAKHHQAQATQKAYEELARLANRYNQLKSNWHTPQKAKEGTQNRFIRQSSQNYARAATLGGRRARTLRRLLAENASVQIDGNTTTGRQQAVKALLHEHMKHNQLELDTVAINGSNVILILRSKEGDTTTAYLKETLSYQEHTVTRCVIQTLQKKPEIPDEYAIYTL